MAQTARISQRSNCIIQEISALTGKSKIEIIELALETYQHSERMRLFNESYRTLAKNNKAWIKEQREREELEGTFEDDLEED